MGRAQVEKQFGEVRQLTVIMCGTQKSTNTGSLHHAYEHSLLYLFLYSTETNGKSFHLTSPIMVFFKSLIPSVFLFMVLLPIYLYFSLVLLNYLPFTWVLVGFLLFVCLLDLVFFYFYRSQYPSTRIISSANQKFNA